MVRLRVGRPVGVLPSWGVIAVAALLAHGHPTSTCNAGVNYVSSVIKLRVIIYMK